jgi:hypothetical protein
MSKIFKDRNQAILDIACEHTANASRADMEFVYLEHIADYLADFTDEELVRWAENYGVDYEELPEVSA